MTAIVKAKKAALQGEILPPTIPGTYGAIERYPQKAVEGEVLPPDPLSSYAIFANYALSFANKAIERVMTTPFGSDAIEGEVVHGNGNIYPRTWNCNPAMRRLGYLRAPEWCRHERKAFSPASGWTCRDCGDLVQKQKSRLVL